MGGVAGLTYLPSLNTLFSRPRLANENGPGVFESMIFVSYRILQSCQCLGPANPFMSPT